MSDSNFVGNVVRDVELKFLNSGQAAAKMAVAVNRRWKNRNGEQQEETSYFDVVAYGKLAENIADSCPKGTRVIVTGRLQQRTWETQDGGKRSTVELVADAIGPDLSWATAIVTKNPHNNAGGQPQSNASLPEDPW